MAPRLVSRRPVCGNGAIAPGIYMRHSAPVSAPRTKSFRREPGATGQNSCQPEGLQPESAAHRSVEQGPRLRGCDRGGARESHGFGALHVALRGRIQAYGAWNLLRPPCDASLLVLAIERLLPSPGALPSPILAATHTRFIMLGTLSANSGAQITAAAIS